MRAMVEAWGRKLWPDARVIHELKMDPCRCDLAFVLPNDLIAVEIKSSKDTLDRLEKQVEVYARHATFVYLAIAPKWDGARELGYLASTIVVNAETRGIDQRGFYRGKPNWRCYTTMINMLWAEEARAICRRHGLDVGRRSPLGHMLPQIAGNLTGKQIVAEVCREIRGRPTRHKADAPILIDQPVFAAAPVFL